MAFIKGSYRDPYTVRDSEIAPPYRSTKTFYDTWIICIRNNAKNGFGAYTGLQSTAIGVKQGRIDQVDNGRFDCDRQNLEYLPFPIR